MAGRSVTSGTDAGAEAASRRLAAIVAASDEAIFTKSPEAIITSWDAAAERIYGYSAEEAIGRPVTLLIPPDRHGEERAILARILAGERIERYETVRVSRDGRRLDVSLVVAPGRDPEGRIVEAVVMARDVTAARRVEHERERLRDVTAGLSQAASESDVVDVVLDRGFAAAQADAAIIAVLRDGGRLEVLGMRGYSRQLADQMLGVEVDSETPLAEALRTGRSVWVDDRREAVARYPATAARFKLGEDRAVGAVPLVVRGRTIGALGLRFRGGRPIDADERAFIVTLAHQCAQALDRAALYEAAYEDRRRAEYLARAGELLAGSLNPQATLEQVARLAVPELADWAFVELLREDGTVGREVIVHRDPAKEAWVRELAERFPVDLDAPYGSGKVIRTGEPELLAEMGDEVLEAVADSEEMLEILRKVAFVSGMVVPLRARGRILGDLALASAESGRRFSQADLTMAQALADRCALALDNARLFAERSYIAKTLQEGLLPAALPDIPRVELGVRYRAATHEADVGGDFYDVFAAGGGWMFVTGDVVGKGARAAAVTGLARHTLRAAALYEPSPEAMLRVLNRAMLEQLASDEQFCTVAVAHLRGTELRVTVAGHPLPLVLRAGGTVEPAGRPGALIGVFDDPPLERDVVVLGEGDTVLLYTDGVTEARGSAGRFGTARLSALMTLSVGLAPGALVERIDRALSAYRTGAAADDSALVAFRLRSDA